MSTTTKPVNQKAWFLILPVILCVAFSAIVPLMTVVNYSVQDIISPERRVWRPISRLCSTLACSKSSMF